ncbi:MAG TPA: TldD/PmbA family protein [Polyangia bacterium]|jgi:predicted Zn-dependent protease|nr:TldD/PmbA family protein [Polyangia bacterium]
MSLDEKAAYQLLGDLLGLARKVAPGADVQLVLNTGRNANTRFAASEITSTGDVEETEIQVGVTFGRRHAEATTNQTDPASLGALLERVVQMARIVPEDPELQPMLGAQKYPSVPPSYDPAIERLGAAERAAAAASAIAAAEAAQVAAAGFYSHSVGALALANSAGLRAYHRQTLAHFTLTARTHDSTGSGWAGAVADRLADIDPRRVAATAIDKAVRSAKPRRLEPGRYTVVLEPAAVADLLGFLAGSLGARAADEGRSFFARPGGGTRIGEKLFDESITLRSDPAEPGQPSAPFDVEGFPLRPYTWIERGTLRALTYSRFWAAKKGQQPTGAPRGFHLLGGQASREDLLKGVERGLLVTRFWYTRYLDPQTITITGLTRDGVFLIEKGEIVAPVNNFRFNESPVNMLKNVEALSRETVRSPFAPNVRAPALRTREFNFASISEAV